MSDVATSDIPSLSPVPRKNRKGLILALVALGVVVAVAAGYVALQGSHVQKLATVPAHKGFILGLAFTPDGQTLISGGQDGTIKYWDPASRTERRSLDQGSSILSLTVAPDGKRFATGGVDCKARVWDLESGRVLATVDNGERWVKSVAFRPDGSVLVIGDGKDVLMETSTKSMIQAWKLPACKVKTTLAGHGRGEIHALLFTRDGKTLLSASGDPSGSVYFWNFDGARLEERVNAHAKDIFGLALSPDGAILASAGQDHQIQLIDVPSRKIVATLSGHQNNVTCIAFSPDGKTLAAGDSDGIVKLWDVPTRRERDTFRAHDTWVARIAYSPDGQLLVTSKGGPVPAIGVMQQGEICFWKLPAQR